MCRELLHRWASYRWLSLFFEELNKSQESSLTPVTFRVPVTETLLQEYTDLLKGTNSAIFIPLWASLCLNDDGLLYDETTKAVIEFYYQWGYHPIKIDSNPPDYIGEQFNFLCYLYAAALNLIKNDKLADDCHAAIERFKNLFLLDTIKTVSKGILTYAKSDIFIKVAQMMSYLMQDEYNGTVLNEFCNLSDNQIIEAMRSTPSYAGLQSPIRMPESRIIHTAGRNNCGGKCSVDVTVQEGCLLQVDASVNIGSPQVRACVRGRGYRKTYLNGRRLRYPMVRVGERGEGRFRRISWAEAVDLVASEWVRIRDTYGPASRYVNYGIGVSAVIRPDHLAKRLLNLDGGHLTYYGSYSFACTRYVTPYVYGDIYSGNSLEDILNTSLLILWGHNPAETNFGSQRNYYLSQLKEQGTRIIVIDPRQSDSALVYADEWIGIKPSTDSALADAMAYIIWSEGLQDQHFMDKYCIGFDERHMPEDASQNQSLHSYIFGFQDGVIKTPEWAEEITGVSADTITRLAHEYATTKPACLLPGLGNQRIGNGEQTVRSMAMLACMTGNVGVPGGGAAGSGVVNEHLLPSFPQGDNPYPGSISCFLWSKAIDKAQDMEPINDGLKGVDRLDTGIKLLINFASNTLVNQHSDINNSIHILKDTKKCELILCSDVFMTPSAKFADLLLPAPSFLEDDNIATPWNYGHYLLHNNKAIDPVFESKNEYDFLYMVAERIGLVEKWSSGHHHYGGWLKDIYDDLRAKTTELPEYDVFRSNGGYTYKNPKPYIAYEKQISDPDNFKFNTPSGKIEIYSSRLASMNNPEHIPAIPKYTPCPEGPNDRLIKTYPLQLVGWHTKRRCHSIHDNNSWLEEVEPQRIWIHPDDAMVRNIKDNDLVAVFNDRGRILITATVTTRVIRGVVAIPQGAWFTPNDEGIDTRGSINVLTSMRPTPLAKGNPQHTNLVEVVLETSSLPKLKIK